MPPAGLPALGGRTFRSDIKICLLPALAAEELILPLLVEFYAGGGAVGAGFRRLRHDLTTNQVAGTIKISQGTVATITVISDAMLSARTETDSRRASPIGVKTPTLATVLSTRKS